MKHPSRYPTLGQIRYSYISQVLDTPGDAGFSPELRLGIIRQALRGLSVSQLAEVRTLVEARTGEALERLSYLES